MSGGALPALDVLYERHDASPLPLTPRLAAAYGGPLRMRDRCVVSNFVASLDGVVALREHDRNSGSEISARNDADRYVMALLRACASAVVIGAGTLRATPGHHWTADHLLPEWSDDFAALRTALRLAPRPHLYVLSGRGLVDHEHVALQHDATVITAAAGEDALRTRDGSAVRVHVADGTERVDIRAVLDIIRGDGHDVVLTEGGPHVIGELLRAKLLDDVFLTLAPRVFGRDHDVVRFGMVEGVTFDPGTAPEFSLHNVRRSGEHVFLRYAAHHDA